MIRHSILFVLAMASFGTACAPATTYNRGIQVSYHPSGKADAHERLVPSAIVLKSEAEQDVVRNAGGIYVGELEVKGSRTGSISTQSGVGTLNGRISLEAANRGATHLYPASSSVGTEYRIENNQSVTISTTQARYVLFRVEADGWDRLPADLRPTSSVPSVVASQ